MEKMTDHSCMARRVEKLATVEQPFHFADSGLPNVYLVGIKYFVCDCGSVVAEIPAVKQLMQLIARDIVESSSDLTGAEVRFLRKRLGKRHPSTPNSWDSPPKHSRESRTGNSQFQSKLRSLPNSRTACSRRTRILLNVLSPYFNRFWRRSRVVGRKRSSSKWMTARSGGNSRRLSPVTAMRYWR